MKTAEYLSVLVSIIVGLGISQVLSGVANLLVDRRRVRFDWIWAVAVLMTFMAQVQFWWSTFSVGDAVAGNFFSFFFFLLTPIALFLASVIILPDFEGEGEIVLRDHFQENHRWYFALLAVVPVLNVIRSMAISHDPLWMPSRPYEIAFTLLLASGVVIGRRAYQGILALTLVALFTLFLVTVGAAPG